MSGLMFVVTIWAVLAVLIFIMFMSDGGPVGIDDGILIIFLTGILTALITFVTFMGSIPLTKEIETVTQRETIVSLNTKMSVEGTFVLGTGVVHGKEVYTAFQQRSDGAYTKIYFTTGKSLIYQDTSKHNSHAVLFYQKESFGWPFHKTNKKLKKIELHVPKGTVVKQFNAR